MRVQTKTFCLALVQLSWMLASGMISCKVEVASGPCTVSHERALSDVVLRCSESPSLRYVSHPRS